MTALFTASASAASPAPFAGLSGIDGWLTGPLGTGVAVIAVAWFGFSLLGGRLSLRRGGLVVLGCFVLFGAPSIARGLLGLAGETRGLIAVSGPVTFDVSPPAVPTPPAYDPYAGAAMPSGQ
jgi:type IV secretion system protein VirB2